jgi:TetR/AcrR family transcriptional repressor of nem operon
MTQPDTRQRIVASARDLIYGRSYASVGVAEICQHADVKKGSFYHFFPSKQDLSLAVIDDLRATLEARVLIPAFARDLPPLQRLEHFIEALYEFQCTAARPTEQVLGCPFGNLTLELATSDEVVRGKLVTVFATIESYIAQALHDAQAAGELVEVDVAATASAMLAYVEGILLLAKTANDPALIRRLGAALAAIRISPAPANA